MEEKADAQVAGLQISFLVICRQREQVHLWKAKFALDHLKDFLAETPLHHTQYLLP